jgi:hypothetical protein
MKKLLFLFFTFQLFYSQQVSYKYDTRINFIFEEDSTKGTSIEFNSKDSKTPIISKTYLWKTESASNSVSFHTMQNGQMYKMTGDLIGERFLNSNGYTTFVRDNGVFYFKKITSELFEYKGYRDLEKSVADLENGVSVEIFTKKMNDGVNYSPATMNFMGEIYGIAPPLEQGEFLVYSSLTTKNGYLMPITTTLEKIVNEVFVDYEQIKAIIEDNYQEFSAKRDHDNMPGFCYVTSPAEDAEEHTQELIDEFLDKMCELDMVWMNKLKKGEFNSIYLGEMERKYQLYKNHKVLSPKQLAIFKRELLNYLPEN